MLREEIESHFGEEHNEEDRRYYLRTLYNEKDYYCAYGQLLATGEFPRRPRLGLPSLACGLCPRARKVPSPVTNMYSEPRRGPSKPSDSF